jgi:hypothetical protein
MGYYVNSEYSSGECEGDNDSDDDDDTICGYNMLTSCSAFQRPPTFCILRALMVY